FPVFKMRRGLVAMFLLAVSEIIRIAFINERWLTNGVWGIRGIPKPFINYVGPANYNHFYPGLTLFILALVYFAVERAENSSWGRVLRSIGENELLAAGFGKNVWKYKMQSFVISASIAGIAGSLYAHYASYIDPTAFRPWMATFIVWLMVIVGGTGNKRGVILGSFAVWGVWIFSVNVANLAPFTLTTVGYVRMLVTGILLWAVLVTRPQGLLGQPEAISAITDENEAG
ncbi:MAG: branched-chain amino acid ABC transporter permease, partial [Candidatus Acetothermia bacterium]